jgi:hypothetical protein
MADITSPRHLSPARRSRSYPRMVKRARHNSYRVKRPGDTGTRHPRPGRCPPRKSRDDSHRSVIKIG